MLLTCYYFQVNGTHKFVLGNIHVLFNPKRGDVKLGQVLLSALFIAVCILCTYINFLRTWPFADGLLPIEFIFLTISYFLFHHPRTLSNLLFSILILPADSHAT